MNLSVYYRGQARRRRLRSRFTTGFETGSLAARSPYVEVLLHEAARSAFAYWVLKARGRKERCGS